MKVMVMKLLPLIPLTLLLAACAAENSAPLPEEKYITQLEQCILYIDAGEFDNALRACKNAVRDDPTAEAQLTLGIVYLELGKNNLALDAVKKAVALNPRDAVAHYNLCVIYAVTNRIDLALEALGAALDNGFNNTDALRSDHHLDNLRGEPGFAALLERHHIFIQ